MIDFYWYPQTRAVRTLWLLNELGVPFEQHLIDLRDPEAGRPEGFLQASPMGKVPAIKDGEVVLAESSAIALFLADKYSAGNLAPALTHNDRGKYLYWSIFSSAVIEPAMMERFNQWEVNRASSGWGNFDSMIQTLEGGLQQGPWILGEAFSAADTLVGSTAYFMKAFGILPESPVIEAYIDRCVARPAYAEAIAAN